MKNPTIFYTPFQKRIVITVGDPRDWSYYQASRSHMARANLRRDTKKMYNSFQKRYFFCFVFAACTKA